MEHCPMCDRDQPGLSKTRVYSGGLFVCPQCRDQVNQNRGRHYSKVMERFALLETGYHINRKEARILAHRAS